LLNVLEKQKRATTTMQQQIEEMKFMWEIDRKELSILRELNRGSYGVIYKGYWRGSLVAIKKLHITQATKNEAALVEFKEEVSKLSKLRPHPNIVQFLGGSTKDPILMVTELVDGGDLVSKIEEKKVIKPKHACKIIKGIAAGMHHLHSEGIVHRDLAARNILLTKENNVKISDFGYARVIGSDEAKHTIQNEGPLRWMAPETIFENDLGERQYSRKSDVWMFGVVLYEIFYRKLPYYWISDKLKAILGVHNREATLPIPEIPVVNVIMKKALEYDAGDRWTFQEITTEFTKLKEEDIPMIPPEGLTSGLTEQMKKHLHQPAKK